MARVSEYLDDELTVLNPVGGRLDRVQGPPPEPSRRPKPPDASRRGD